MNAKKKKPKAAKTAKKKLAAKKTVKKKSAPKKTAKKKAVAKKTAKKAVARKAATPAKKKSRVAGSKKTASASKKKAARPAKKAGKTKPVKMGLKDLRYFEDLINQKRQKLLEELGYMQESSLGKNSRDASGDLSNYSYHMADQASDTMEKEQNFRLAQREGEFLHHLNEAIYRIRHGSYGICKSCQNLISKERLEAVPHTTMCISCKSADQLRRR